MLLHEGLDSLSDVVLNARELIHLVIHRIDPPVGEMIAPGNFGGSCAALLLPQREEFPSGLL
jgi:hypothetical protein